MKQGLYAFDGSITNKNVKKKYRIITMEEPPFVFKSKELPENEPDKYHYDEKSGMYFYGYCIDLILELESRMKVRWRRMILPCSQISEMGTFWWFIVITMLRYLNGDPVSW